MDSDSRKKDKTIIQKKNEADRQKSRNLIKKRLGTGEGWILKIVERVDYAFFERLSLLNWLTRWRPEWYGNISVAESDVTP